MLKKALFLFLLLPPLYTKTEDYRATGIIVISCLTAGTGLYLALCKKERSTLEEVCGLGLVTVSFIGVLDSMKIVNAWDKAFKKQ